MSLEYLAERSSFACRALQNQMLRFFHISWSQNSICPVPSASLVLPFGTWLPVRGCEGGGEFGGGRGNGCLCFFLKITTDIFLPFC